MRQYRFAKRCRGVASIRLLPDAYAVSVTSGSFVAPPTLENMVNGQTIRREILLPVSPRAVGGVDMKGQPTADAAVVVHPFGDHVSTEADGRFDAACSVSQGAKDGFVTARDVKRNLVGAVRLGDLSEPLDIDLVRRGPSPAPSSMPTESAFLRPECRSICIGPVTTAVSTWRS